ncbi:cellobiose phosphorylase [Legionella steigerwaltii]|uniref:Cellobiose phosphorylase n=1 Tax=Legionella steigerwaltii TaxID=460 RepID=A0A378LEH9_9GAMM|nr:ChbG/HpnK family deacetylase [Legionella steigerwaltii]KTD78730.1 cellobiose phosphorylase [Legionella steigerwaltii]STY24179.1 cellobiose phosphorylase [Legionella steigerwaltii]
MIDSKTIVLCADDFGLDSGVSEGILKLVCMGRLSAVSCMVNMPGFISYAKELLSLKKSKHIKIGLHFNLTEGYLASTPEKLGFTLHELLIKTHMRSMKLSFIAKEFLAQLDQFINIMQQPPDFIDGHQHVHQFPVIRQVILDLYEQRLKNYGTSIRSTWPSINLPQSRFKAKVLGFTGGKALLRQLIKLGIPHNRYFSGIYDFAPETNYRELFRKWMSLIKENTLIMCHPAEKVSPADPIARARLNEFNYFLSDEFLKDCDEFHVHLAQHEGSL